ncbi:MAG: glucosamine-6-phosphate deaminase [Clostridiales bacterium]|nr:glucosamine-6-phosphate deaminase [Clostridiales bacterium]
MRMIKAKNYDDMSRKVANILSAHVILKPNSVLGLATGSTVIGTYKQLIDWYRKDDLDFDMVSTVNLDEYVGLDSTHEQSYRYYMNHNFFNHINIRMSQTYLPDGKAKDIVSECQSYEYKIKSLGGVDVQLLGLGHNGHIGFNEPDKAFEQTTHCVTLEENTRTANARFFSNIDEVPTHAITMGIKTIMQAKQIVLAVSGADKAEILKKVLTGPVTPGIPGSILQMHPDVIVVADEAALSQL